jgi:hypothetical protein
MQTVQIVASRQKRPTEAIMIPSHSELEVRATESRISLGHREAALRHLMWHGELDERKAFARPAFSPWLTAAQMAFAVGFTILGLSLVLASIVAITRA